MNLVNNIEDDRQVLLKLTEYANVSTVINIINVDDENATQIERK